MDLKKPEISVIMSTYNRKDFLPRSIESILAQTYDNFEFILVNNGSTDGSDILCKEYSMKDSRIRVINIAENRGASAGKNRGIDAALCDYITIVDDDDYCEPEMLEFLWGLTNKYNADISICGSWYEFNGIRRPKYILDELFVLNKVRGIEEMLKREKYNISPPTKLFRRALFKDIRFKENVLVDDIHVIYKIFAEAETVVFHGKPLYTFVRHSSNMTSFNHMNELSPKILDEYLSAFNERTAYLSKKIPEIKDRARYSEWSYMISMCGKIIKYGLDECEKQYAYMIRRLRENHEEIWNSPFTTEKEKEFMQKYVTENFEW